MLKYEVIARDMLATIENNKMEQGDQLPVLEDFVAQYGVSKNTIIKALELLETHGIIYQVRGSGTFVRGHRRQGYINLIENQGFNSALRDFKLTSVILALDVIAASEEVAYNLKIDVGQEVYYVKRLRKIEDRIFCVEDSYFDKSIVTFMNEQIVSDSIFQYLTKGLNLKVGFSDQFLRAFKLNQENADHLKLSVGDPAILVESIYHLQNGQPFDYSKIVYHYEETQFFAQGNSYYSLIDFD